MLVLNKSPYVHDHVLLFVFPLSHFGFHSLRQTFFSSSLLFFVKGRRCCAVTWAAPSAIVHRLTDQTDISCTHRRALWCTSAHKSACLPSWKCTAAAVYPVETRKTSCTVLRVKTSSRIINTSPRRSLKLHFGWFLWPSRQRSLPATELDRQLDRYVKD